MVCGASGFLGSHRIKKRKKEGYWVRGAEIEYLDFSPTTADEFLLLDGPEKTKAKKAISGPRDNVCQLDADMGDRGLIHSGETEIKRNGLLINWNNDFFSM